MLGLWGLPQEIIEAVAFHHDPANSVDERFTVLTAVHVANSFCEEEVDLGLEQPSLEEQGESSVDHVYLGKLGLENRLVAWEAISEECAETV